jgi:phosphatidylglycerol:prolipoprotein diacylglycerol transferase
VWSQTVRRTLFYIPHEIAGIPVFGWGWALAIWFIFSGVVLWLTVRQRGWNREVRSQLPMILLVAAAIVWLIPRVEEPLRDTQLTVPPVAATDGLPIRGYGVMLLLAVVGGVGLATARATRAGFGADRMMSLAFVVVIGGIVGARVFFVVQYWQQLQGEDWRQTLSNLLSVDKGGLVVYGSLLGAMLSFALFCRWNRLPMLPLADLIAPSLALGLALGRIGCLLNGCCFGGPCDYPWAMTFPADSPPYLDQKGWGAYHGLRLTANPRGQAVVGAIDPQGPLAATTLQVGDVLIAINGRAIDNLQTARLILEQAGTNLELTVSSGATVASQVVALPARSHPVHPTQIYSSINALLLCLLCLAFYPYRRRHGEVIAGLLTLYAFTRFLEEVIRSDEPSFVAGLTISQAVSVLVALAMAALWVYIPSQPRIRERAAGSGLAAVGAVAK